MSPIDPDDLNTLSGDHPLRVVGRRILVSESTGSTHADARRLVETLGAGACHGYVLTAREQRSGRGTRGRSWWSPADASLSVSVVLSPSPALEPALIVTLLAALAVEDAARHFGADLHVKWPNDLVDAKGRKVAGVLAESLNAERPVQIVGIGVNLRASREERPKWLEPAPGHLEQAGGRTIRRAAFLLELLDALERQLECLRTGGSGAIARSFNDRSWLRGKRVRLRRGEELRAGTFEGITPELEVLLRESSGRQTCWPGGQVELLGFETTGI